LNYYCDCNIYRYQQKQKVTRASVENVHLLISSTIIFIYPVFFFF